LTSKKKLKRTIGGKLLLSYLVILVLTFVVSLTAYNRVSEGYLINKATESLEEDVSEITKLFRLSERIPNDEIGDSIAKARVANELRLAGRYFDSKIVILTEDGKLAYKSDRSITYESLMEVAESAKDSNKYIFEREPIKVAGGKNGHIIVYTTVEDVVSMRKIGFSVFALSFSIGGVIAFVVSLIFQRQIGKPIKKLSRAMGAYSFNDPVADLNIKTGDEIEELADTFDKMSNKIQVYHAQQKVFFQNASHELKTPLMSIQGYAEAIKDGVIEDEERDESLDIIIAESQRLKKIVEEMILLTKLEDEQEPFDFRQATLEDIIKGSVRALSSLFSMHEVKVDLELAVDGKGAYDVDKLTRAFINILGNCARYAKTEIRVRMEAIGGVIYIEIGDDGTGFKNGEEDRVFERFYKGHGGGSGIGLALTKTIIERHGGEVWAENKSVGGAQFTIKLPLK